MTFIMKSNALRTFKLAPLVLFLGTSLLVTQAIAAEAEVDVMGKGNTQLEFKLAHSKDKSADYKETSTPFLARIGVTDDLEIRIAADGYIKSTAQGESTRGMGDTNLGVRWRLQETDEKTGQVGMALQLEQGLPTGARAFKSDGGSTALKYTAAWALPNDMFIGVQPGLLRVKNEAGRWYVSPSVSVTVAKNWTPQLRTVAELIAPQISSATNGGNQIFAALGATYTLSDMLELEVFYARSLNSNAPTDNIAAGVNIKF
ncbi:MAG TPA: transporter [Burkholderiaceae bacterium]|nr:transporter [Burkholderiaceae bacterium]